MAAWAGALGVGLWRMQRWAATTMMWLCGLAILIMPAYAAWGVPGGLVLFQVVANALILGYLAFVRGQFHDDAPARQAASA